MQSTAVVFENMSMEAKKVFEEEIEDEKLKEFCGQTFSFKECFIRVQPYQTIFPRGYSQLEPRVQGAEILEDDVWVTSHPKSGTRWIQELVWLLKNNLDYEKASTVQLNMREPYFDMAAIDPKNRFGTKDSFDWIKMCPTPRIIKSHLNYDMLPKTLHEGKNKIVVIMRNPRDTCCSLFNHYRITDKYTGSFETLVDCFLNDTLPYYGPFFTHAFSFWNRRHLPNLHIVFYEDMQANFSTVVKKLAEFLEVTIDEKNIPALKEYLSFEKMKVNPMVNMEEKIKLIKEKMDNTMEGQMINKGKTGTWKEMFTEDMVRRFQQWEEKWLKESDLKFVYEI